jgi:hypothetical protein
MRATHIVLPLFLLSIGCGGTESGGSPSDSGANSDDSLVDGTPDAVGDPLVGVWEGNLVGYVFPSGSTKIVLTFAKSTDGTYVAGIQFGEGPPPPPATDPSVGYPAGVTPATPPEKHFYAEGFDYTANSLTISDSTITFDINLFTLWKDWCSLEPVIDWSPDLPGQFGCVSHWKWTSNPDGTCTETNPSTGELVPIDCGKLTLCLVDRVCLCKTGGCVLADSNASIKGIADFTHETMDFSISGAPITGNAVLTRQPS